MKARSAVLRLFGSLRDDLFTHQGRQTSNGTFAIFPVRRTRADAAP